MSPGSLSLDSQHPLTRPQHFQPGPPKVFSSALRQQSNREYLDKLINIELPRFYGEGVKQVQLTKAVPFKTAILEPEAARGGHPLALGLLPQKHVKGG